VIVTEPLRLSFRVACAPAHAFEIWTTRVSTWWPADHTVTGRADAEVVIEGRLGGRIFERTPSGEVHEWGEVTDWAPPQRLGYLWHLRQDRADATEVQIRFVAEGAATRIEIEHRGWERLGSKGAETRNRNVAGWGGLLPHYAAACAGTGENPLERPQPTGRGRRTDVQQRSPS